MLQARPREAIKICITWVRTQQASFSFIKLKKHRMGNVGALYD